MSELPYVRSGARVHLLLAGAGAPTPPRPRHRGDCLTAVRRRELHALYGHDSEPGEPYLDDGLDGTNAQRPCHYVGCKYHLGLEYNPHTGNVVLASAPSDEALAHRLAHLQVIPDPDVYHPAAFGMHTCGLDVADIAREDGTVTLEEVGLAMGKTRERIRQVSDGAYAVLLPLMGELAAREGEDVRKVNGRTSTPPETSVLLASGERIPVLQAKLNTLVVRCQGCAHPITVRRTTLARQNHVLCRKCARK